MHLEPSLPADYASALEAALIDLKVTVRQLSGIEERKAHQNATIFLSALGHFVLAWIWLELAVAAMRGQSGAGASNFYDGKLRACRDFYECEVPKSEAGIFANTERCVRYRRIQTVFRIFSKHFLVRSAPVRGEISSIGFIVGFRDRSVKIACSNEVERLAARPADMLQDHQFAGSIGS